MIPKIVYPTFTIIQPSNKKELIFRRYLVREEKILLMAKETNELSEIFHAIKQVITACCQTPEFDTNSIPLFDLEFIYLRLRSNSVNNIEKFTVKDAEDGKNYDLLANFDNIIIDMSKEIDKKIRVDGGVVIVMQYPKATIYDDSGLGEKIRKEGIFDLVLACINEVYVGDELQFLDKAEMVEFVNNLDVKTYKKMEEFLLNMPSLKCELNYKNSLGNDRKLIFNSLLDFFLYL